jgi:uroporphyrinogen-III synthase
VRILITRPRSEAEATAAKLHARGCEVLVAPLLHVEPIIAEFGAGPWSAVALTSANAVRALEKHPQLNGLLALPVFTVGRRTAAAARAIGFRNVASADGNVRDLTKLIVARHRGGTILYPAGEDRSGEIAIEGVGVQTVVVYRAESASQFPSAARDALAASEIGGVLHYSRRSAEAFISCAKASGIFVNTLKLLHYCLSAQVAEPLQEAGARAVRIAPRAEEAALLDLIELPSA